jgi:hypothetical protein
MTAISRRRDERDAAQAQSPEAYEAVLRKQAEEGGPLKRAAGGARLNRYEADQAQQTVSTGIKDRAENMPTYTAAAVPTRQADAVANVQAAQYQSPEQSANYINKMRESMGIRSPEEQMGAKRDAVMGALNRESYMGALRDSQNLAQQGQSTGARSQALSQGQMDQMRQAMMGDALQQGQVMSQFDANNARFDLGKAQDVANRGLEINDMTNQRRLQEIQSQLMKNNALQEAEMFDFGAKEGNVMRFKDMIPGLIQQGMGIAGAAV